MANQSKNFGNTGNITREIGAFFAAKRSPLIELGMFAKKNTSIQQKPSSPTSEKSENVDAKNTNNEQTNKAANSTPSNQAKAA